MSRLRKTCLLGTLIVSAWTACACGTDANTLSLAAFSTPRDAYSEIITAFQRTPQGRGITFQESYMASGPQTRAILAGFEADIAALATQADINKLAPLMGNTALSNTPRPARIVSHSLVVIGVRAGNPKGIHDWQDLARPGVQVLMPNVRTSGAARWIILAICGSAQQSDQHKIDLLAAILRNVRVMDSAARESLLSFERGVGDAVINYEQEIIAGRASGQSYEAVLPSSTILVEYPVVTIEASLRSHGTRAVAENFVGFLFEPTAQAIFAAHGFRPAIDPMPASQQTLHRVFRVADLGGWRAVQAHIFAPGAVYERALAQSRNDLAEAR